MNYMTQSHISDVDNNLVAPENELEDKQIGDQDVIDRLLEKEAIVEVDAKAKKSTSKKSTSKKVDVEVDAKVSAK